MPQLGVPYQSKYDIVSSFPYVLRAASCGGYRHLLFAWTQGIRCTHGDCNSEALARLTALSRNQSGLASAAILCVRSDV